MSEKHRIWLLFIQIFIFQAGFGMVIPLLPLYTQNFAIGTVGVGFVVAVYGLARVVTDLPAARLIARVGHSNAMATGALALTVGSTLTAFSSSLGELLAYRFISGAGAAITLVAGQTMAATNPGPYTRAKAIGLYQSWFLAGVGIGPMFAGPLAEAWSQRAPFLAYAALAAAVALLGFLGKSPELPDRTQHKRAAAGESLLLLRDIPFLLVSLITLMIFFTRTGGQHSLVPLLGTQHYQLTTTLVGVAVGVNGVVNLIVTFVTGMILDRFDHPRMLVSGVLALVLAMITYATFDVGGAFFAAAILWGVGAGLAGPVTAVYVTERAGANVTGATALYRMISDVGYLLGPILMGLSASGWGIPVTFIWCAAVLGLVTVVFVIHGASLTRRSEGGAGQAPKLQGVLASADLGRDYSAASKDDPFAALSNIALGPLDAPRMVFVHTNGIGPSTWIYQLVHLSTWYRCIAIDVPLYGTPASGGPGVIAAQSVWGAVDRAGGDPRAPAVLVGSAAGIEIVQLMYYARPTQTAAIVLSGAGWGGSGGRYIGIEGVRMDGENRGTYKRKGVLEDFSPGFRGTGMASWYASLEGEPPKAVDADVITEIYAAAVDHDLGNPCTGLQVPILILTGSLDSTYPRALALDENLPDSVLITLEGAGHACYFEQPHEFDSHLINFLMDRMPEALRPTPALALKFAAWRSEPDQKGAR